MSLKFWWVFQRLGDRTASAYHLSKQIPFFLPSLGLKHKSKACGVATCTWHKSSPENTEAELCMVEQDDYCQRKQNGKEAVPNWDKWFLFILFPSLYYL